MRGLAWKSAAAGVVLMLSTLGPAGLVHAAGNNQNGNNQNGTNQNGNNQNGNLQNVNLLATPELDSLLLFGGGAAGLGGYALLALRARRKSAGR